MEREKEKTLFIVGAHCIKIYFIFFLLVMRKMVRGKKSSFLSSAATICKPGCNISESLN